MSKRFEIYIGFKCNNDCIFCVEYYRRQKYKDLEVLKTESEIMKILQDYKNQGYEHVNILGGEPFIEKNFPLILQTAKEMGFITAVTTNGGVLSNESVARKCLPLIDDLILSIHGHNKKLINQISGNVNLYDNLVAAFVNINKYFKGRILKANTVINKLNYKYLLEIVKFIKKGGIQEISLTSMSVDERNKDYAIEFSKIMLILEKVAKYCSEQGIKLRFADIPFCFLGDYYHLSNHLFWDNRNKFDVDGKKVVMDRPKIKNKECNLCIYNDLCQGLDENYKNIFGDKELKKII